jgi:hypothetical protein
MTADKNRQQMPNIAAIVDEFREAFGEITVTYAEENGIIKGKVGERGIVPVLERKNAKSNNR